MRELILNVVMRLIGYYDINIDVLAKADRENRVEGALITIETLSTHIEEMDAKSLNQKDLLLFLSGLCTNLKSKL